MSSTTIFAAAATAQTMIGDLAAAPTAPARLYEKLDTDFCSGGKQILSTTCSSQGPEVAAATARRESASEALSEGTKEADAMVQAQLTKHIETTRHAHLKVKLPPLVEKPDQIANKQAWRNARLPQVAATVRALAARQY